MTNTDHPVPANSQAPAPVANAPLPETGWARLTDRVLVRISGPGTDTFLQGQFSQHLDEVTSSHSPRASASTPKGRAYCLTRLVRDGADILLDLEAELAEATLEHLRKYLMLFRGTSAEILTSARVFGVLGETLADTLAGGQEATLSAPGDTLKLPQGFLIRVEDTAEGLCRHELWQLTGTPDRLAAPEEIPLADWQASEIAAGVPHLSAATREAFVPQMLNWQHLGGIHFRKGCYTGQEVIARMHFLGQLKKSLFRLRLDHIPSAPAPGTGVVSGDRSVGTVINAMGFSDGHCQLLAVVRHDADPARLAIDGTPEQLLELLPLPYSVPEQEAAPGSDT